MLNQDPIRTLETDDTVRLFFPDGNVTAQEWCISLCIRLRRPFPPSDFKPRGAVQARINHNRWIVECPFCPGGALPVSKKDPRFWCVVCGMQRNEGHPLWVAFPREMQTIETILMMRDDPATRNWLPHETVTQLARENISNGAVRRVF